jgi:hypothetical protein
MAREKTVRLLLTHLVVRRRHHVAPTASGLVRHSEHVLCRYIRHRVQDCARRPQRRARGRSRFSAAEHAERGQPRVRQGAPRCRLIGDCATATRQQTDAALVELLRAIEAAEPAMALGRAFRPFPDGCRSAFWARHLASAISAGSARPEPRSRDSVRSNHKNCG